MVSLQKPQKPQKQIKPHSSKGNKKKKEELTVQQKKEVVEYHKRFFAQATSTVPANRVRAERAAHRLAKIAEIKVTSIRWVNTPTDGEAIYCKNLDPFMASPWGSIVRSSRTIIWDSLGDLLTGFNVSIMIWESLRYSLKNSLNTEVTDLLSDSFFDSLWDTGWLAYCNHSFAKNINEYSNEVRELIQLHNEILESCFAVWFVPGKIILCERPKSVKIKNGNLVGLTWRK